MRLTFYDIIIKILISPLTNVRVCLFRSETGWIENFEEKIGRKGFLECIWLDGEEGNKL